MGRERGVLDLLREEITSAIFIWRDLISQWRYGIYRAGSIVFFITGVGLDLQKERSSEFWLEVQESYLLRTQLSVKSRSSFRTAFFLCALQFEQIMGLGLLSFVKGNWFVGSGI